MTHQHGLPKTLPSVTFQTRVRDDSIEGDNPFRWQEVTTEELFEDKECILFALPGAFTPTCSTYQLPNFEKLYSDFAKHGVDEIYCLSVNDSFVMNCWARDNDVKNIKMIPDGNAEFTYKMNMLVNKNNLGFGARSWRYAAHTKGMDVVEQFVEQGWTHNAEDDPYEESDPYNILEYFNQQQPLFD